jgi:hypothetical protein
MYYFGFRFVSEGETEDSISKPQTTINNTNMTYAKERIVAAIHELLLQCILGLKSFLRKRVFEKFCSP